MTEPVNDLLTGLAQLLASAGIATYRADGSAYLDTETGVGIGKLPEQCPRAVMLTDYLAPNDSPDLAMGVVGLQVWTRGLPDDRMDVNQLRGDIFRVFHGLSNQQFGSCGVDQMLRFSSIPMGQDDNRRWENSCNYHVDTTVPATLYRH